MACPPFKITPKIVNKVQDVSRELGNISGQKMAHIPLKLRRSNSLKTIQSSLAIEGNSLSLDQVTDLLEGKRVLAPSKDILEAKNALSLYESLNSFDPLKIKNLCRVHGILMKGMIEEAGQWRSGGVGIFKGREVSHTLRRHLRKKFQN